ncbi:MAG TPA: thiamine-phosphate kinase [Candidatus Eisenbacteria bacterium]|nr:thiamine-phosphate kinase [Candidatus Eisenbacteria bacterium]
MPALRELGEREVVRRLIQLAGAADEAHGVAVSAGDDAAVLTPTPGMELVVTTDASVEGRHWPAAWFGAGPASAAHGALEAAIGTRLAMANLSDLAAMAATPRWATVSIGVRAHDAFEPLERVQEALVAGLARGGAVLVGGNVAAVDGARWFSLTLIGELPRGRAWTRAGARPGDLLAVTGRPGRAAAALRLLARDGAAAGRDAAAREVMQSFVSPEPRAALAVALREAGGVTAAIDVSDGLVGDLAQLCDASGVGAELDPALGPDDPALEQVARALDETTRVLRAGPGDDYELLLALDAGAVERCAAIARERDTPLAVIGRLTDAPGLLRVRAASGLETIEPRGFDHFA